MDSWGFGMGGGLAKGRHGLDLLGSAWRLLQAQSARPRQSGGAPSQSVSCAKQVFMAGCRGQAAHNCKFLLCFRDISKRLMQTKVDWRLPPAG